MMLVGLRVHLVFKMPFVLLIHGLVTFADADTGDTDNHVDVSTSTNIVGATVPSEPVFVLVELTVMFCHSLDPQILLRISAELKHPLRSTSIPLVLNLLH
jgi:hypothetical protein